MNINIVVNKGNFENINIAAHSESIINWWDEGDDKSTVCTECYAAGELQKYLEKFFKFSVCITDVDTFINGFSGNVFAQNEFQTVFLIGNATTNKAVSYLENILKCSISVTSQVQNEGFRMKALQFRNTRYFILSGKDRVGTLYAVYAFLERIGMRWYTPEEYGTCCLNTMGDLFYKLPSDLDIIENPSFLTRGCYSEYLDDSCLELIEWMSHNRMNYARFKCFTNEPLLKKLGINICMGGHDVLFKVMDPDSEYPYNHKLFGGSSHAEDPYSISEWYKGDADGDMKLSYKEAHPEWFGMINGEWRGKRDRIYAARGYYTGDNICTSNNDCVSELSRLIIDELNAGEWSKADYLDFWLLDNGRWCECPECKKSGNYTSRLLMLIYKLLKEINKAYSNGKLKRRINIIFPAYHETLDVPDRPLPDDFDYRHCFVTFFPIERCYVHYIYDEKCTETNKELMNKYLPWTVSDNFKGEIFIGEYYNVSSFASMPIVLKEMISHDIPFYYKTGVRHFFYMHITSGGWGPNFVNNYLHSKLLWNICADSENIYSELLHLYYCDMSSYIETFYTKLEQATANIKFIKHYQWGNGVIKSLWGEISKGSNIIFPFKHLKLDEQIDDPNSGISFTKTMETISECRQLLDRAIMKCENNMVSIRLSIDDMRFTYGEHMLKFLYYLSRTIIFRNTGKEDLAKSTFQHVIENGEILRRMEKPLENYLYGKEFTNGLTATWIEDFYNKMREELFPL